MLSAAVASIGLLAAPAEAAANPWPHSVVNGFSTPSGTGFWIVYGDGTVNPYGTARFLGDASNLALKGPIVGGAVAPDGRGYWLVARDGGIFTFGSARFYGSMGGVQLNQPVFSMTPTKSGHGYWLVARDGGIFSFGDARFYGSTGNFTLSQPINGITTSPTGQGYRMVARDGGIFSFGDAPFYGSLPALGLHVSDGVGMAPTPSNRGYWLARSGGEIYAFGDAHPFNDYPPSACDPVTAMFTNPKAQGFRLVLRSGATIPIGKAPGGRYPTGVAVGCPAGTVSPVVVTIDEYDTITISMTYDDVVAVVGGPGVLVEDYKRNGHDDAFYMWQAPGGASALIEFKDYHVISKAQVGLNPPTMSLGEFLGVTTNMSYGEVQFLVGGPGTLVSVTNRGAYQETLYAWSGNGGSALVHFVNDREVSKTEVGLR
jgi:ribosomal protein L24E